MRFGTRWVAGSSLMSVSLVLSRASWDGNVEGVFGSSRFWSVAICWR